MTKALFKKQMMEIFSWLFRSRKKGKSLSKGSMAGYTLLYLLVFVSLGAMFYQIAAAMCAPLAEAGLGWLFFALMGLLAVALGVFGSIFSTYSSLYLSKDNDLLLSMPIPPSRILMVRLFGVLAMGMMYELIVMVPALIVFFRDGAVGTLGIVFSLLLTLVLAILVLSLSCVLGWVVALVGSRIRRKNVVVVLLSLAFIVGYYYIYSKAYSMLQRLLTDPQSVGDKVRSILYPFYHLGMAAEGSVRSMLVFSAMAMVLFGVVWLVLSRSFLTLTTANRGAAKVQYREKTVRVVSADRALLRKELRRFLGSPTYMLNCGLGTVLMIVAGGALLIKSGTVKDMLALVFTGQEDILALMAAAAVCMVTCMNTITAPSVSLEGKDLWQVQSLPVSAWQALRAKLKLHLALTLVPALLLAVCVDAVLRPELAFALLIPAVTVLFVLFMALLGLFLNLKMPNLNWTNEAVPVKQSMSVMLALFGGWVVVLALGGLYVLAWRFVSPALYLLCTAVLLLAAAAVLLKWLKGRGAEIFEKL